MLCTLPPGRWSVVALHRHAQIPLVKALLIWAVLETRGLVPRRGYIFPARGSHQTVAQPPRLTRSPPLRPRKPPPDVENHAVAKPATSPAAKATGPTAKPISVPAKRPASIPAVANAGLRPRRLPRTPPPDYEYSNFALEAR